jgi:hypothetical protein
LSRQFLKRALMREVDQGESFLVLSRTAQLLALAQRVQAPVSGGIELVVGPAPQGHRTGLKSPLALGIFCGDRRHRRSPSSARWPGTRACGVAVIVLEEPTEPFAALERHGPPPAAGRSTRMRRREGGALISLPLWPLSPGRHQHDLAWTVVGAFSRIMGFVRGAGIASGAFAKEDQP